MRNHLYQAALAVQGTAITFPSVLPDHRYPAIGVLTQQPAAF
jgi:hypothetical protein